MTHPAETTKVDKAAELKQKLLAARAAGGGGNGQSAPATSATETPTKTPAKAPAKKRTAVKAAPPKQPAKAPAKAPEKKSEAPRKAQKASPKGERHRTMDRDKNGDGLRPAERDIVKIVKQARKPIAIRDIAIAMFGENKVKRADDGETKDNTLVRVVRNGIRKPREYGMLKLWTETKDKDAKSGFVVVGDGKPVQGAASTARKAAKSKASKQPAKRKAAKK